MLVLLSFSPGIGRIKIYQIDDNLLEKRPTNAAQITKLDRCRSYNTHIGINFEIIEVPDNYNYYIISYNSNDGGGTGVTILFYIDEHLRDEAYEHLTIYDDAMDPHDVYGPRVIGHIEFPKLVPNTCKFYNHLYGLFRFPYDHKLIKFVRINPKYDNLIEYGTYIIDFDNPFYIVKNHGLCIKRNLKEDDEIVEIYQSAQKIANCAD